MNTDMPSSASQESPWWTTFHTREMADLFLQRNDPTELNGTISFLMEHLELTPSSRLFDQCCGIGGLSWPLAARGIHVTGCDLCPAYIERAREIPAGHQPPPVNPVFHCADAFEFVPEEPCDAALNWYSSFGYSPDDRLNQKMMNRAADSLRPNGLFAIDVPNFVRLIRHFQPRMHHEGMSDGRPVRLTRRSSLDLANGMLRQRWCWEVNGEMVEHHSALRLYLPHQICDMLAEAGFIDIRLYGECDGTPLEPESARLIAVARRND